MIVFNYIHVYARNYIIINKKMLKSWSITSSRRW